MSAARRLWAPGCALLLVWLAACAGRSSPPPRSARASSAGNPRPSPLAARGSEPDAARLHVASQDGDPALPRPVVPQVISLGDLPVLQSPEPAAAPQAPVTMFLPPAAEVWIDFKGRTPELTETNLVRVTLRNQKLAWLRVGKAEGAVTSDSQGGATVICGQKAARISSSQGGIVPARWETLAAAPSGGLIYTVVDAWFDIANCTVGVASRSSVTARPILGGVLFAFRETCANCAHREQVTFLGPRLQRVAASGFGGQAQTAQGLWSRVTLPLRRGGSGTFVSRLHGFDLQSWASACGLAVLSGEAPPELLVGVEISQAVDDKKPIAIGYTSARGSNRGL